MIEHKHKIAALMYLADSKRHDTSDYPADMIAPAVWARLLDEDLIWHPTGFGVTEFLITRKGHQYLGNALR